MPYLHTNLVKDQYYHEPVGVLYEELKIWYRHKYNNVFPYSKDKFVKYLKSNNYNIEKREVRFFGYSENHRFINGYKFKDSYNFNSELKGYRDQLNIIVDLSDSDDS
jgi:hypothetical protein